MTVPPLTSFNPRNKAKRLLNIVFHKGEYIAANPNDVKQGIDDQAQIDTSAWFIVKYLP